MKIKTSQNFVLIVHFSSSPHSGEAQFVSKLWVTFIWRVQPLCAEHLELTGHYHVHYLSLPFSYCKFPSFFLSSFGLAHIKPM